MYECRGNQVTKSATNDEFSNSVISETTVPEGSGNFGSFSGGGGLSTLASLKFESTALSAAGSGYPTYNWGTFLHIKTDSPLVNAGHEGGDVDRAATTPQELELNRLRYFRDVDDQVGPLGPTVLNVDGKPVYRRDVGADEVPTPDGGGSGTTIQWWERV